MGRRAIAEYQVYYSKKPNGKKHWFILGRPGGKGSDGKRAKSIRAWYSSKEKASPEATKRNAQLSRLGSAAAAVDNSLIVMASEGQAHLRPYGETIRDAVAFRLEYLKNCAASKPLDVFLEEFETDMRERVAVGSLKQRCWPSMNSTIMFEPASKVAIPRKFW